VIGIVNIYQLKYEVLNIYSFRYEVLNIDDILI